MTCKELRAEVEAFLMEHHHDFAERGTQFLNERLATSFSATYSPETGKAFIAKEQIPEFRDRIVLPFVGDFVRALLDSIYEEEGV